MRQVTGIVAALVLSLAAQAHAETLELSADRPVVETRINGRPARLLVDTTLPDVMVLDPDSARRLRVSAVPMVRAQVTSDDFSITGKIARPRIDFANGKASRALTGLFAARYTATADIDGALGPGALPWDSVRVVLRTGPTAARARTFALENPDVWRVRAPLAATSGVLAFNIARRETVLSRPATRLLSTAGLLQPAGPTAPLSYPLGLTTTVQPVTTETAIGAFAFGPTFARTDAPLTPPDGLEVTVTAKGRETPVYEVTLGRAALADCTDMVWSRRARSLTLHCQ